MFFENLGEFMRTFRKSILATALLTALLGSGISAAQAGTNDADAGSIVYVGTSIAGETTDGGQVITLENSVLLSEEEVRQSITLEEFALSGKNLKEIRKYYPEATPSDIKRIQREAASQPELMITHPPCNNIDFYSIVRAGDNAEYCFANAGTMSFYMPGIYKVCPGNNNGHLLYQFIAGDYYISPDRGPVLPRDTCFFFSQNVTVWDVTIN